ncbi:MAG: activator of HSP90 ATPase 1 family protein [Saprospiraceae bacterium]|nr:activator of HSP90 ATPase 1 family protein [Saprospiraceae bacterium]
MERSKIELEYIIKASPTILYQFLTTPACLVRWFCDAADVYDDFFVFSWKGNDEIAFLIDDIEEERLRLRWEDADNEKEYFEYAITTSPITEETILTITDFCDKDEIDYQKNYWNNNVESLKKVMGA